MAVTALGTPSAIMSEEDLAYKEAAKKGGSLDNISSNSHSSSRRASTARSQSVSRREVQLSKRSSGDRQMVVPKEAKGMILPFEPLSMSFDELSYFVDMPAVSTLISLLLFRRIQFKYSIDQFGQMVSLVTYVR